MESAFAEIDDIRQRYRGGRIRRCAEALGIDQGTAEAAFRAHKARSAYAAHWQAGEAQSPSDSFAGGTGELLRIALVFLAGAVGRTP